MLYRLWIYRLSVASCSAMGYIYLLLFGAHAQNRYVCSYTTLFIVVVLFSLVVVVGGVCLPENKNEEKRNYLFCRNKSNEGTVLYVNVCTYYIETGKSKYAIFFLSSFSFCQTPDEHQATRFCHGMQTSRTKEKRAQFPACASHESVECLSMSTWTNGHLFFDFHSILCERVILLFLFLFRLHRRLNGINLIFFSLFWIWCSIQCRRGQYPTWTWISWKLVKFETNKMAFSCNTYYIIFFFNGIISHFPPPLPPFCRLFHNGNSISSPISFAWTMEYDSIQLTVSHWRTTLV